MATAPTKTIARAIDEYTKPAFLRRVRIRGYKSIAFCDVELQPLTILVGRNASGKSNFVDALAFLCDAMETNVAAAARRHGGTDSLLFRHDKSEYIEIGLECEYPSYGMICRAEYSVRFRTRKRALIEVEQEDLRIQDTASSRACGFNVVRGKTTWMGLEHFGEGGFARISPEQAESKSSTKNKSYPILFDNFQPDRLLLAVIGSQPFVEIGERLRASGFYNFHPEAIRKPCRADSSPQLERDGNNLAHAIEAQLEIDEKQVDRITSYLSVITGDVERFDLVRRDEFETIRFRHRAVGNNKPMILNAASMSDGTLRALAALVAAFQIMIPMDAGIVAIEEPETSLHPAAMRALVDAMDEATTHNQILLTTHSAELLDGRDITPGQVLVVRNRDGQTHITPVDRASREIIQKELYTLADLQRMDRLDLDESDLKRQGHLSKGRKGA